jgi:hypothetical protein
VTRDEFNSRLRQQGGFRVTVRLFPERDGGRTTGLSGDHEYRVNWSIDSDDPDRQAGAPTLIDAPALAPGEESAASLIRLFPEAWPSDLPIGTKLTAFEGRRAVAEAVVTDVLHPEP